MRDWIAVIMAILGVLLVLAGATIIVLRALSGPDTPPASGTHSYGESTTELTTSSRPAIPARLAQAARRMPAADRLIAWGIVLLILAAIAAGAIGFKIDLSANSG
jgi:hypothetical protein